MKTREKIIRKNSYARLQNRMWPATVGIVREMAGINQQEKGKGRRTAMIVIGDGRPWLMNNPTSCHYFAIMRFPAL